MGRVAYVETTIDPHKHEYRSAVWVVPTAGGAPRRFSSVPANANSPAWSPDGRWLAFLSDREGDLSGLDPQAQKKHGKGKSQLWLLPTDGGDGLTLYVLAAQRGATRLYSFQASQVPDPQPVVLTPGNIHVRDFSIDAARNTLALLLGDATHPQEVFVSSTQPSAELRCVSHANDALLEELELASPELITYSGANNWLIDGWIMKPRDFDPTKKNPLVVEIHGGPNTQYGYGFFHEMQLLVAQGYVVFYTNPRGSIGYGYEFADAVRGAWGEKDSLDIICGVEEVIALGYIDEQRLAVTGGSYGGFMTNWLIGHHLSMFFRPGIFHEMPGLLLTDLVSYSGCQGANFISARLRKPEGAIISEANAEWDAGFSRDRIVGEAFFLHIQAG